MTLQAIDNFTIAGETDICQDQSSLYSTTAYEGVDYVWSTVPDDAGTILGDPNRNEIEILWHSEGPATVQLEVCGQMTNEAVIVRPRPKPVVNHPTDLCPNVVAMVQTTTTFDAYTWKDENGSVVSTVATPDLGPGYYQVVVENEYGCIGDTTFYINGYPPR